MSQSATLQSPFNLAAEFEVQDLLTKETVPAEILFDVPKDQLEAIEKVWGAYRVRHPWTGLKKPGNAEWYWPLKQNVHRDTARIIGLKVDGELQGLLMFSTQEVVSRSGGATGQRVLYVEYLETAPASRKGYVGPGKRYRLVGTQLLSCAVHISLESGCEGRLALHSLSEAKNFYRGVGFDDLGFDEAAGYEYFELAEESAKRLA